MLAVRDKAASLQSYRTPRNAARVALYIFSGGVIFALGVLATGLLHIGASGFLGFALTGSFVVFCQERRRWTEVGASALLGLGLLAAYVLLGGRFHAYIGSPLAIPGAFAGLGSLTFLCIRYLDAADAERQRLRGTLLRASLVPALCAFAFTALSLAATFTPRTWDYLIYAFDRKLGIDTFLLGRWLLRWPLLFMTAGLVYNSQPLYVALTLLALRSRGQSRAFMLEAIALGLVGFMAYQICPAAGPIYRFKNLFPHTTPGLGSLGLAPAPLAPVFRNAMPSLHVGWAILCYWNLRLVNRTIAVSAFVYLLITVLATIGCGEHYFADLIVSTPLALFIRAALAQTATPNRRFAIATAGALATVCWLLALRTGFALSSPAAAWLAVIITVAGSFSGERLLRNTSAHDVQCPGIVPNALSRSDAESVPL